MFCLLLVICFGCKILICFLLFCSVTVIVVVDKTRHAAGAMRKSSPVIVGSLIVMVTALAFSILGSNKYDVKTLIAAILYISAGTVIIIIIIIVVFVIVVDVVAEAPRICFLDQHSISK